MVVILVPVYKPEFTTHEKIPLRHLDHYLGRYPKIAIQPAGMGANLPGFDIQEFPAYHFTDIQSYSKLLLSPAFYETFAEYDYILIYQLDCLVFSDQLTEWCSKGYDYIGAPLACSKSDPGKGFSRVGNGGFSLRKVKSFLNVLNSQRYVDYKVPYIKDLAEVTLPDLCEKGLFARFIKKLKLLRQVRNGVDWYTSNYTLNEDLFWSDRAKLFYPDFKIAPVDEGLKFAFERHPRSCFELNHRQLPFGCHAWAKWDRKFWEPYLLNG